MEYAVATRVTLISEIKRLNAMLRNLREQKKAMDLALYEYMVRRSLENYEGITIKSVRPRVRRRILPKEAERREKKRTSRSRRGRRNN